MKNNEFAGVDDKFVPKEETTKKSSSITDDDIHGAIRKHGPKALGVAKKVGIGYIAFIVGSFLIGIAIFIAIAVVMINMFNKAEDQFDRHDQTQQQVEDQYQQIYEDVTHQMQTSNNN